MSAAARVAPSIALSRWHSTSRREPCELAPGEIEAADDDREHVVEIVRDAAGELADRLHLLDLAELRLGGGALGRLGFEAGIGVGELRGARPHRLFEVERAQRLRLGIAPRLHAFDERAVGEDGEAHRAEADQDRQPAEPFGIGVGAGDEALRLLHPPGEVGAFGPGDLLELGAQGWEGARLTRGVEDVEAARALAPLGGGRGGGELGAAALQEGREARSCAASARHRRGPGAAAGRPAKRPNAIR